MGITGKTKEELLREISGLRECITELEKTDSERENVETVLRQTEEKYRNIYENATEGIFQASVDGRFISANPSLARIHGYDSPEELIESISNIARQLYVNPADGFELI
ncbi:MAG: PAS domain S-box protein, partial [Syntrophorhabdaceae bacterium]|nr:PAS domain S-box protein [Syntrophorhabdaceae bacterium]